MSSSKYRIRYQRQGEAGTIPCTKDVYGVSALSALNAFHREIQLSKEMAEDRKTVTRPKLAPDQYSITSMAMVFNSDPSGKARGEWVESAFDLPKNSKNPDLRPKKQSDSATDFGFMGELQSGRLAE